MKKSNLALMFVTLAMWRVVKFSAMTIWMLVRLFFSILCAMLGVNTVHVDHEIPLEATKGGIRLP